MTENPLDEFDLEAFFKSVAQNGMANALAEKQPELPAPVEKDAQFASRHKQFQAKILMDFFGGKSFRSTKAIAKDFKQNFEAAKQAVLTYSPEEMERKLYEKTTMETLSQVARQKFDEAVTHSGQSLPGSSKEALYRKAADTWGLIGQIVEEAADIEE